MGPLAAMQAFGVSAVLVTLLSPSSTQARVPPPPSAPVAANRAIMRFDFDGDSVNDWGIWRPSEHKFWVKPGSGARPTSAIFGQAGDLPVCDDYDGDGTTDLALWTPATGVWTYRKKSGSLVSTTWATVPGDIPVPGDWDNDGRSDFALFRPADGTWRFLYANGLSWISPPYGERFDTPVPSDYDGDGRLDLAYWRASTGLWSVKYSSNGATQTFGPLGSPIDIPVPADYDGDKKADFAVFEYASGAVIMAQSGSGYAGMSMRPIHEPADPTTDDISFDIPVPSWYPGGNNVINSQRAHLAVYNPTHGIWYMELYSDTPNVHWGDVAGDIPLTRYAAQRTVQGSPISANHTTAESLLEYARKCDEAIGVAVPTFDCDNTDPALGPVAVTLAGQGQPGDTSCAYPSRLRGACDPGSKLLRLYNGDATHPVDIVASCRASNSPGSPKYDDVAVIQTNRVNGVSCFYQAELSHSAMTTVFPSPRSPDTLWFMPAETAAIRCVSCHDNGAIMRTPYFTHLGADLPGTNTLPGSHDSSYNRDQPYQFVGRHFADWKTWDVKQSTGGSTNTCNGCHRMGIHSTDSAGTISYGGVALRFGLEATAMSESSKLPHGPDSPIWMLPGQIYYDPLNEQSAQAVAACAQKAVTAGTVDNVPPDPNCEFVSVGFSREPTPAAVRGPAPSRPATPAEVQIVVSAYRNVLHRHPTDAELTAALVRVEAGLTQAQLEAELHP